MEYPDDITWNPHPKQGDLVKCADWTKFPGQVGYVLRVDMSDVDYNDQFRWKSLLCKVLVDGQIRDFLGWDVEVISE